MFLRRQSFCSLQHDLPSRPPGIVIDYSSPVGVQRLGLRDDVECAPLMKLHIDMTEGLESCPEAALGPTYALGHGTDPPMLTRQNGDDPIGLTQTLGAQHDTLVPVQAHGRHSLPWAQISAPTARGRYGHPMADERTTASPSPWGMTSAQIRSAAIAVLVVVVAFQAGGWLLVRLSDLLILIGVSWLLSVAMEPVVLWLTKRGLRRGLASALTLLGIVASTLAFLALFGTMLFSQLASLIRSLPNVVADVLTWVNERFALSLDVAELAGRIDPGAISSTLGGFAGGIVGVVNALVGALISLLMVMLFTFYMSADGPALRRTIGSWLPRRSQQVFVRVWDITVEKTGGFVISKLVLATVSAVAHAALYLILDVPYWLPMALFTGIVSQFIPAVGTYIAIAIPLLFVVFDNPFAAIVIIIFATVYQQVENLLLSPKISRLTMDVHPAIAVASVIVGATLLGAIGAIIAIPVAAAIVAVIDTYGQRYELIPELHAAAQVSNEGNGLTAADD